MGYNLYIFHSPYIARKHGWNKNLLAIFSRGWKTPIDGGIRGVYDTLWLWLTVCYGKYDGPNRNRWWLPFLIAWVDFPWQTASHNQRVYEWYDIWLVVWNMNGFFSPIVGMMIQSDELIFFRGVETTNQTWYSISLLGLRVRWVKYVKFFTGLCCYWSHSPKICAIFLPGSLNFLQAFYPCRARRVSQRASAMKIVGDSVVVRPVMIRGYRSRTVETNWMLP